MIDIKAVYPHICPALSPALRTGARADNDLEGVAGGVGVELHLLKVNRNISDTSVLLVRLGEGRTEGKEGANEVATVRWRTILSFTSGRPLVKFVDTILRSSVYLRFSRFPLPPSLCPSLPLPLPPPPPPSRPSYLCLFIAAHLAKGISCLLSTSLECSRVVGPGSHAEIITWWKGRGRGEGKRE